MLGDESGNKQNPASDSQKEEVDRNHLRGSKLRVEVGMGRQKTNFWDK